MASYVFARLIADARGASRYRTALNIVLKIGNQSMRGRILTLAVFLDRLQRDPVQIAAKQSGQVFGVGASRKRAAARELALCTNLRARARRIRFPQLPQHFLGSAFLPVP